MKKIAVKKKIKKPTIKDKKNPTIKKKKSSIVDEIASKKLENLGVVDLIRFIILEKVDNTIKQILNGWSDKELFSVFEEMILFKLSVKDSLNLFIFIRNIIEPKVKRLYSGKLDDFDVCINCMDRYLTKYPNTEEWDSEKSEQFGRYVKKCVQLLASMVVVKKQKS
jgi:hypothetical protein